MSPAAGKAAAATGCTLIRSVTYCSNNITQVFFDGKKRKPADCDLTKCSLLVSHWGYLPNIPSNIFFIVFFALIFIAAIPLSVWKRTWGVLAGLTIGAAFEAVGTLGRVQAANSPFAFNPFLIYIIFLTIGPSFLSAAIYLCLARIIVVYGEENARFKPATYSLVFMFSDFVSLVLQGAGGGIAATAKDDEDKAQRGINVMIAGLVWQVASLTLFAIAAGDFWWCLKQGKGTSDPRFLHLRSQTRWTGFLWSLAVATVLIYIRSVYRVAELVEGFTGTIANLEVPYMIFEPLMIGGACICLIGWHPAYVFGDMWQQADYRQTKDKTSTLEHGEKSFNEKKSGLAIKIPFKSNKDKSHKKRNSGSQQHIHQPGCPNANRGGIPNHGNNTYISHAPNAAWDSNPRTPLLTTHHDTRMGSVSHLYGAQHPQQIYPHTAVLPRRPSELATTHNTTTHNYGFHPSTARDHRRPSDYSTPAPRNPYDQRRPSEQSMTSNYSRRPSHAEQYSSGHAHAQYPMSARPGVDERHAQQWVAAHQAGYPRSATLAPRTPFVKGERQQEW